MGGIHASARVASRAGVWLVALAGWWRRWAGLVAVLVCAGAWVRVMVCRWSGCAYGLRPVAACFVCAGVYACVSRWPSARWWRWPAVSLVLRLAVCRSGPLVQASQVRTHEGRAGAGLLVAMVCRLPVASLPACRPADLRRLPPGVFTAPGLVS